MYFELKDECIGSSSSHMMSLIIETTEPVFSLNHVLDPGLRYCIGIAAVTGTGIGEFS